MTSEAGEKPANCRPAASAFVHESVRLLGLAFSGLGDQLLELLVRLAEVRDPQLLLAVVNEQELVAFLLVPVTRAVRLLGPALGDRLR